jgi:hypothetical protein
MIKLITPPGMLLTVALLVIYSVYAFLIGSIEDSWILFAGGAISVVAAYGTAMLRPWSQYLVYLLTAGFIAKLGHSIYAGVVSGFFDFQFGSVSESLKALAPSALLAVLSCICCFLAYSHFRRAQARRAGGTTKVEISHSADTSKSPGM